MIPEIVLDACTTEPLDRSFQCRSMCKNQMRCKRMHNGEEPWLMCTQHQRHHLMNKILSMVDLEKKILGSAEHPLNKLHRRTMLESRSVFVKKFDLNSFLDMEDQFSQGELDTPYLTNLILEDPDVDPTLLTRISEKNMRIYEVIYRFKSVSNVDEFPTIQSLRRLSLRVNNVPDASSITDLIRRHPYLKSLTLKFKCKITELNFSTLHLKELSIRFQKNNGGLRNFFLDNQNNLDKIVIKNLDETEIKVNGDIELRTLQNCHDVLFVQDEDE